MITRQWQHARRISRKVSDKALYFNSLAKKAIGLDKEILVLLAKRKPEYTKSNCKGVG